MAKQAIDGKRVHVKLTTPQIKYLEKQSARTGLTQSDLIRRAVDAAIARDRKA